MTAFIGAHVLIAILVAAFLQDLAYTSKTVLVSRGRRTLAAVADVFAMVASSLYLILTASVTIRSGLSIATVEAFAAIAAGGAGGTIAGMLAANWLERRFTFVSHRVERSIGEPQKSLSELMPAAFQSITNQVRTYIEMILVAGGTGRLGTKVVTLLRRRGEDVRGLTRDKTRAAT